MDDAAARQLGAPVREGAPAGTRLRALEGVVPPPEISELWLFPPLPELESSAEFFLLTRFREDGRRRVYTARVQPANGGPPRQVVVEHGAVPAERVPRLVNRLQRRLGDGHRPRHVVIDGERPRWEALVVELGGRAREDGDGTGEERDRAPEDGRAPLEEGASG